MPAMTQERPRAQTQKGLAENSPTPIAFRVFKYTIYALLAFNIFLYVRYRNPVEALDAAGWVILLAAYEYETSYFDLDYSSNVEKYTLAIIQAVGYGLATYAAVNYAHAGEWFDVVNAGLWIVVCISIGYDIYAPGDYRAWEWRLRNALKFALYGSLFVLAIWWGMQHDLLDSYDAVLWILSFVVIEMNIVRKVK